MTVSVLTLNLWNDSGPWTARQDRIREWIDRLEPDLIGFQEALKSDAFDQIATLLGDRSYQTEYVRASAFWRDSDSISFGNAVASRWPIVSRDECRLPDRGDSEARAALTVGVDAPVGRISFTTTHLNWKLHQSDTRVKQVVALTDHVLKLRPPGGFPPIVVGDFNADPDADEIRFMRGAHAVGDRGVYFNDAWLCAGEPERDAKGATWSNRNPYARVAHEPDRRIDYIFSGYAQRDGVGRVERCRIVCNDERDGVWPSDHFGLYAEYRSEPVDDADGAV